MMNGPVEQLYSASQRSMNMFLVQSTTIHVIDFDASYIEKERLYSLSEDCDHEVHEAASVSGQ